MRRRPLAPIPRAFHTLFDARKYMLSQFDEPLEVIGGAKIGKSHVKAEKAQEEKEEFDALIAVAAERLRKRREIEIAEEISSEETESQDSQGSFTMDIICDSKQI